MSNKNQATNNSNAEKPQAVIRFGNVKATIWKNDTDGDSFTTATISRTFRRADGSYGDSNSFALQELLAVREVAQRAAEMIADEANAED